MRKAKVTAQKRVRWQTLVEDLEEPMSGGGCSYTLAMMMRDYQSLIQFGF